MSEPSRSGVQPALPKFPDEQLLQQAIASLLNRIPDFDGVQTLHGTQEHGKDIVFRAPGPLGERLVCACVVKNKPFSGKVGASSGLRTILQQVEQAFDTPYIDEHAESRMVHRVYVMNPHQVAPEALSAAAGKLQNRLGQVEFVTGAQLYALFREHWPDFLAAESSILARFKKNLEQASGSTNSLMSLVFEHHLGEAAEVANHIYVTPSFSRDLNLYVLPKDIEGRFSVKWKLRDPWRYSDLVDLQKFADPHLQFVRHLGDWPFPGLATRPNLHQAVTSYSKLVESLESALVAAFRLRSGAGKVNLSQLHPNVTVTLLPEDLDKLTRTAERAEREIQTCLRDVAALLLEANRTLEKMTTASDELLRDPDFIRLCAIDDCLRASHSTIPQIASRREFQFSKGIHQRCSSSLLIVGGPGTGKTSFCTRNALSDAEHFGQDPSARLPVYVPLHKLERSGAATAEEMFLATAGQSALIPHGDVSFRDRPLRLYLDGLDEISGSAERARVLTAARTCASDGEGRQVILTARDYLYNPHLVWLLRIALKGLDEEEVRSLAFQWLDSDAAAADDFMKQLSMVPCIQRLVRTPLLATVTILIFKRTKRLPENRARLYTVYVNLLCGGWDLAKGVVRPSKFTIGSKILALTSLASEMHRERQREFGVDQFVRVGDRVLSRRPPEDVNALLAEVVRDGLVVQAADRFYFSHLTFQEYLAAKEMIGDPHGSRLDLLLDDYVSGDDWWREVLFFAIGLTDNPERLAVWLRNHVDIYSGRGKSVRQVFSETFPDFDMDKC